VTVTSPSGRRQLSLPQQGRVGDLLPGIVGICEPGADAVGWTLKPQGAKVLYANESLATAGIFSGALLELIEPEQLEALVDERTTAAPLAERLRAMLRRPEIEPRIDSMGDRQYLEFLDQAIASREISRSLVVAVMSAHPGAGTTTVAALLATLLGRLRPDTVALADANPNSGALSHWLAPDAPRPELGGNLLPQEVRVALVAIDNRVSVLPAPSGDVDWDRLIEHLRHLHKIVVLDCAAGFRKPVSRAALAAADLAVIVAGPTRRALEIPAARTVVIVENQSPRQARAHHTAAGAQVVTVVDDPSAAHRLKTRGFLWSQAPASWQESIRELAAVLVGSAS
jgi:Mrp family chromosome partitioning ATPase